VLAAHVQRLLWAAMLVAGVAAWAGRPRGGWRGDDEVPGWLLRGDAVTAPTGATEPSFPSG
jgi:hypothetical protein